MKKLIIIASIFFILSLASCSRFKLMDSVDIYEDPNVIVITIEKR